MENYIIIFNNGRKFTTNKITTKLEDELCNNNISIIRTSDCKELLPNGEWQSIGCILNYKS